MASSDKQKQSLYFPEDMLREIMSESVRLDRSLSWTVQHAWRLAREAVRKFPAADVRGEPNRAAAAPPSPARPADAAPRDADPHRNCASTQVLEFLKGKFDRELSR